MAQHERLLLDPQWRFHLGDITWTKQNMQWAKGASFRYGPPDPDYDDRDWRWVDLPHDFVVEGNFQKLGALDAPDTEGAKSHLMHGFKPGGVGWYRKKFLVPAEDCEKILSIEFDGIFRNSTVWLNRHYLAQHLSGYTGFRCDITDLVNYGGWNTLVVRVDATEYEGWFYEGGGIYRHTWLVKTNRLAVAPHGVFVTCDVDVAGSTPRAAATIRTTVRNAQTAAQACRVISTLRDPGGQAVAAVECPLDIAAADETEAVQTVAIPGPRLWSPDSPNLYSLTTAIVKDGVTIDEVTTAFGARQIRFDPNEGFFLNGRHLMLKGVCCHQDHAGVGAALPDRLQEYRIARLKEMGCNAYRTAHNPPTPELLDACDRLGMLVLDENRILGTSVEVLGQLEDLVRRDRNHPCVFLWSLGNEEGGLQGTETGARIAATMKQVVHRLDPTRLVTLAMNGAWGQGASRVVDVQGCNYIKCGDADAFHRQFPAQPILFTESASAVGTRGIYAKDPVRGYMQAYDNGEVGWGDPAELNWAYCDQRPFIAGTFVWTGFDYRGEPTPIGDWPCVNSHFGILDTCGFPKDAFYYYQAWWSDRTVLHVFPHWNWPEREGQEIDVWVYTNCETVELQLNGRSLGIQTVKRTGHLEWKVPYEPGALTAIGRRGGREIATTRVETTGAPAGIRLIPDRGELQADGEDAAVVRGEVIDAQGRIVPIADNEIAFNLAGNGRLIGVGNGDPSSHEDDKGTVRRAFNGLCQAIVQTTREAGLLKLTASSPGLREATLEMNAAACRPRPWVAVLDLKQHSRVECSGLLPTPAHLSAVALPPPELEMKHR